MNQKISKSVTDLYYLYNKIDGAKEAEGVTTLNAIQRFRSSRDSSKTLAAECSYVLAQLYHRAGKAEQAREHGMLALEGMSRRIDVHSTLNITTGSH